MWWVRSTGSCFLNSLRVRQNKKSFSSNPFLKDERWNKDTISIFGVCIGGVTAAIYYGKKRTCGDDVNIIDVKLTPSKPQHSTACSRMLATSASIPKESQRHPFKLTNEEEPSDEFDFIIIGYGNAGKSAEKELLEKCPNARIMVVDPHSMLQREPLSLSKSAFGSTGRIKGGVSYLTGSAMGIDHAKQTIDVFTSSEPMHTRSTGNQITRGAPGIKRIAYKHSMLICSGVRGAPPPDSLVDERATERILELRSTQLPSLNQYILNQSSTKKKHLYPILPSQSVRKIATMAASQGAKVCVLGSDLEAVELAVAAAGSNKIGKDGSKVCLLFGGAAPLGGMLPRYLSTAVTKRLRAHGIDIRERSLVRYISSVSDNSNGTGEIEIHVVKSFDTMDTRRCLADLMVVAPRIRGQQGSASIPSVTSNGNVVFNTWSKLCTDNNHVITCYADDGRIVVNSELSAASGIFAAGSVAKYPNHITGHATVAGEGVLDGSQAGKIAATNMVKNYCERERMDRRHVLRASNVFSNNKSLSVTRTDNLSTTSGLHGEGSALSSIGIHALCVGQCDSETMSTHGFWWTNQSRRLTRRDSVVPNGTTGKSAKAIYGPGVVYYLDRAGNIRGIMLWGLPYTKSSKSDELNNILIDRLKEIIHTNGDIIQEDHADAIQKMRLDPSLLCPSHLAEESRLLASISKSTSSDQKVRKKIPRPLHRFVPSKPMSTTKIGVLKRNEKIGTGSVGEDVFERDGHDLGSVEGERSRHPSLVHYFEYDWNSTQPISLDNLDADENLQHDDDSIYQPISKNPDNAARPPKEEPLWMRKGDAARMQSLNERLGVMFMENLKHGHFSDGTDAVQQAPTPKVVQDARDWIKNKSGGQGDESGE